jgi:hypothetical protein
LSNFEDPWNLGGTYRILKKNMSDTKNVFIHQASCVLDFFGFPFFFFLSFFLIAFALSLHLLIIILPLHKIWFSKPEAKQYDSQVSTIFEFFLLKEKNEKILFIKK